MLSYSRPIERCRPLLGTFVRIRVAGLLPERAHAAIYAAFDEILQIHLIMSFHQANSDVSRLNRTAYAGPVQVDGRTYEVLGGAADLASLSDGAFDISIAPALVARGVLPALPGAPAPRASANWSDIVLLDNYQVRFAKPLWIDLGGIAKGYAVDRAVAVLESFSPAAVCVNAGGDLRLTGKERVRLMPDYRCSTAAMVDLECGSLASSCGEMATFSQRKSLSPHVCTQRYGFRDFHEQFVCVVASRCIDADALTKVVMAAPSGCASILNRYSARALTHDAESGWREIREPA
jgi:FAD:protein FMN transferase